MENEFEIPWPKLVAFHRAIVRRAEEGFWALDASSSTSERWSSVQAFVPLELDGPWQIEAAQLNSGPWRQLLHQGKLETIFLGGPCFVGSATFGSKLKSSWQPLFYREVSINEREGGLEIRPSGDTWVLSPPVHQRLDRWQLRPDLEPDALSAQALVEARRILKQDGSPAHDALYRALVRLIPEVESRFELDPRRAFPTTPPTGWVLFSPPTSVGPYNRHLIRDYDQLERLLVLQKPSEVGGLSLLRPIAQPATPRHAEVLPFVALNTAQERAVSAMLGGQPVTVVSGPPGCGKSQVVVSLLLNAWARGQSVLFASNNNKAVSVVAERLAPFDEDSPVAIRAGSGPSNNVATALRRIIQSAGATTSQKAQWSKALVGSLLEERQVLRGHLDSGTPQQVEEALASALSTFSRSRRMYADLQQRLEVLSDRFRLITGLPISPTAARDVLRSTEQWLLQVAALRDQVPLDTAERERLDDEARGARDHYLKALTECAVSPSSFTDQESVPQLSSIDSSLRAWMLAARETVTAQGARLLADEEWFTAWDRWTSSTHALAFVDTARTVLASVVELLPALRTTVATADEARALHVERRHALVGAGWPPHVTEPSIPPDGLRRWLSLHAELLALPHSSYHPVAWLTRRRVRRQQAVIEASLRPDLPLDVWRSVGALNDAGRSRLADVLESLLRLMEARERLVPATAAASEVAARLAALAPTLISLGISPPRSPLDIEGWLAIAEELRALAQAALDADHGWRARESREELRKRLALVGSSWTELTHGGTLLATWLSERGKDVDTAMTALTTAPTSRVLEIAHEYLQSGPLMQLCESVHDAVLRQDESMRAASRRDAIPSEAERRQAAWSSRGEYVLSLPTDQADWPDRSAFEARLSMLRAWVVEWTAFYDGERPGLLKAIHVERTLASERLREAAASIPPGSASAGIREEVDGILSTDNEWPISQLQERFAPFLPEGIRLRLDELQAELSQSAMDEGRSAWLQRLHTEVDALKAVTTLKHLAGDGGQGDLTAHGDVFRQALRVAPVWITTAQTTRSIPLLPQLFDLVVIDEASQCTLTNLLPMLYRAKRLVVIGDPQQLPAITVVGPSEERHLAEEHDVRRFLLEYGHDRRDLFSVAREALPRGAADVIMLDEHYRSDPLIIGFANRYVYQRKLILRRPPSGPASSSIRQGISHKHVNGRPYRKSGGSWVNEQEARAVLEVVRTVLATGIEPRELGVVTPFAGQKERIGVLLRESGVPEQVHVNTAFGFQGDERQVIVFSAVVSDGVESGTSRWVEQPPNLLNVALTRAKDGLIVVANLDYCRKQSGLLGDLAAYLDDVDVLRNGIIEELSLFNWMTMEGWVPRVHPKVGNETPTFVLAEPQAHRLAVIVRALTELEQPRDERERARALTLAGAGYRVLEFTARDVRETPTAVLKRIRERMTA